MWLSARDRNGLPSGSTKLHAPLLFRATRKNPLFCASIADISIAPLRLLLLLAEGYRGDDDGALDDLLHRGVHAHEDQPVVHHADDEGSGKGPDDGSPAAEEADTAEDN